MRSTHFVRAATPLFVLATTLLPAGPPRDPARAFSAVHGSNPLEKTYRLWSARQGGAGRDRLILQLGWSKGFSRYYSPARGRVEIEAGGSVHVEVDGLDRSLDHEIWLVDNVPGPGRSARPEPGDRTVRVGRLETDGRRAVLDAELGAGFFKGFEVDQVVVTPAGERPEESGILFGSPSVFQRRQRSPVFPSMDELVIRGADLFFNETFDGNGRTCGTCHPAENNLTIDPRFIATLPDDDPLFVAEFVDALSENFEKPVLMRGLGLILENTNGFDDLEDNFTMRGVPHTLALPTSLVPAPPAGDGSGLRADGTTAPPDERTGWSGDGAPGSGTLREFAIGAVTQHFPRTLNRVAPDDFRFPTEEELDAMEAFQLFLGRDEDVDIRALVFRSPIVAAGRDAFVAADSSEGPAGKCNICHANAGSNSGSVPGGFNFNFNTGVEDLPDQPATLLDPENNRPDDGFGRPGVSANGTFNTPTLIEAADTGPFFHNNSVETIEAAVAFYNSDAFNNSPSGQFLARTDSAGIGIRLETTHLVAIAAFLRALNALENIRSSAEFAVFARRGLRSCRKPGCDIDHPGATGSLLRLAREEVIDAGEVLEGGGLHPEAVRKLKEAERLMRSALKSSRASDRDARIAAALRRLEGARADLLAE